MIFSGVHIQPENIPETLLILKPFVPMLHVIDGLRLLFESESSVTFAEVSGHIIFEILLGMGYLLVGYISLRFVERIAKITGRLELTA